MTFWLPSPLSLLKLPIVHDEPPERNSCRVRSYIFVNKKRKRNLHGEFLTNVIFEEAFVHFVHCATLVTKGAINLEKKRCLTFADCRQIALINSI